MKEFRYIDGKATLKLDRKLCVGCGQCTEVCPHRILAVQDGKADILDFDACMECGACAANCPTGAVTVTPGVGCASLIIAGWIHRLTGKKPKTACC